MTCTHCKKSFSPDEIDTDGLCYTCANDDPYYNPDSTAMMKELIENTMNSLAAAKSVSPEKVKSDFVTEHVYNHPEKYIKDIVSNVTKKKNDSESN